MTALTPGCDPDMSITGAPFGAQSASSQVRSALVLLAVIVVSAVVTTGNAPGWVAVAGAVVGVLCALVLVRRGVRLAHRATTVAAAAVARAAHRSQPVPTPAP